MIDLLREKRQAVISHAVTKGLNPNAPLKPSGIDWLGDVPEGWEVVPLKRVTLERCDGPFGSGLKSEHYVDAGMRVVRLQNIKADGFSDDDAAFIDLDYASSELSRHEVLAGDVLIAGLGDERNLVGRACVAPVGIEPAMVKADCFRFRLDTCRAASDFVALQLNTSAAFDAGTKATGTKRAFEFGTMLSFAIPGTVIGVAYILAFNVPPIEITGTGVILVISFIFRNMPVGVRAGIASMSQLDKSLDESSLTLGANSWQTFRAVILPLLRPAILAALVYSFVRAMTAISAVIFLVSARYDMSTSYIIGRVENNDYGLAIAYSTALIFVMLAAVGLLQLLVGRTQIGRRTSHGEGH